MANLGDDSSNASGDGRASRSSGTALTALVVDDEELIRATTAELLRHLGHVALEASTVAGAIALLAERADVDLVLTDWRLPDASGAALLAISRDRWPSLRVVVMTGLDVDEDESFAVEPDGWLQKPFSLSELQRELRR